MRILVLLFLFMVSTAYGLSKDSVVLLVREELKKKLNISQAEIVISSSPNLGEGFNIKGLTLGEKTFQVNLEKSGTISAVRGRFYPLISIPALKVNLSKGTIINSSHLHRTIVRSDRIPTSALLQDELVVGKVAKRNLLPNKVIRDSDLGKPLVVRKNSTVSATYVQNGLRMHLIGVSLEDGGIGDVIKIVNPRSGRGFSALILDEDRVQVKR